MREEFQETVLSARQDEFFRKNMYANFGDLGVAIKVVSNASDSLSSEAPHWSVAVTYCS